jgi:VWFA-related protein
MMRCSAVAVVLSLAVAAPGQGQPARRADPSTSKPTFGAHVEVVEVDAVVTDKQGRHVSDLTAEDFEIREHGRPQAITHFQYIVLDSSEEKAHPAPPAAQAPATAFLRPLRREDTRRSMVFVVDDLSLSFVSFHYVRRMLTKVVDEQMRPGDLVAIVRTSSGMGVLQQFTNDKRLLHAAIDKIRFGFMRRGSLGALYSVVRGLRDLPGRKSVVLVSEGFPSKDDWGDPYQADTFVRGLVDLANQSSVVVYALDPGGLRPLATTAALDDTHRGMAALADGTGGLLVADTNDLVVAASQILDDQKGYYLMGYTPDQSNARARGGRPVYHNPKVVVKRPGLSMRSRRSFVTDDEAKRKPLADQTPYAVLLKAATSPFASVEIPVQLTALFGRDAKKGPQVRALLHIDGRDLTFAEETDGSHKAQVEILALLLGSDGEPVEQFGGEATLRVPHAVFEQALRDGLVRTIDMPVKTPGVYQYRVAVRDIVSGRMGSANQVVEIPDIRKGRFGISGIVLAGPEDDPSASPAVRRFRRGMEVSYACAVYNAPLDRATGQPTIATRVRLFREGELLPIDARLTFDPSRVGDARGMPAGGAVRLPLTLEPGNYTLEVTVADRSGRKKYPAATQWSDFEIVD